MLRTIGFDGDDTLWHNETFFAMTQEQYRDLLRPYASGVALDDRLYETEVRNLRLFGYGAKGFTLSMIETAIEVSEGAITAREVQRIIDAGKALMERPVELIDGVRPTLEHLAGSHTLLLITKGDLFDQESRVAGSGLGDLFAGVEIVAEKDPPTYARILQRYGVAPGEFLMVGNSVRSDILPVVALGALAVHIPYHVTWRHEHVEGAHEGWWELEAITELPALLREVAAGGGVTEARPGAG